MLLAVRCGAHLSNKLLAVERFVRCNDAGGALHSAESINHFTPAQVGELKLKGGGGRAQADAVLRAAQRASVPSLNNHFAPASSG